MTSSNLHPLLLVLGFILLCGNTAICQQALRPERGTRPNRTYSLSDIENISIENGNVNLSIPLASLPPIAGGKLSWTVSANYNSKLWNSLRVQADYSDDLAWHPYVVDSLSLDSGWRIGGQYYMEFRNSNDDFYRLFYPQTSGLPAWELNLLNNFGYWKMVLHMPDGSEHEFRPVDYSPYSGTQDFLRGYFSVSPNGTATRYYSVDGTYMFAKITQQLDWTVFMPDGTRIIQTPDGIQRIQDTNGNKIKIFSDTNGIHYQDEQTNREIRITYDPSANSGQGQTRVWYATVGGLEHHIDINYGTTFVQGKFFSVLDWDPIGVDGHGTTCERAEQLSTALQVVREIVSPQTEPAQPQQIFTFSYNSDTTENSSSFQGGTCAGGSIYTGPVSLGWGELSRMVTPSGSIVDYSYSLDSVHFVSRIDDLSTETITQKKVTHDGTFEIWTYSIQQFGGSMTGPDGNTVTEARHCASSWTSGCVTGKAGLAYRTARPFMMTERHWTNLTFAGANTDSPGGIITLNPVVDFEYTTLLDANNNKLKMSAKAFQYDYNGNVTQTTEYDWFDPTLVTRDTQGVPTAVPASATVLRVTNNSYYNQAATSSSGNVYAKRSVSTGAPLILNAPKQSTLGPANVQLSYDGQAYGVAPIAGNVTTKKVWDDLDSAWITTTNTYDLYGNVATATDGRGKVTQFFYDDATHALPTRVVVDPQNGTGTQTASTAYDFSTGLVTSQTDVNGQITTINYTNQLLNAIDPFARPGIIKGPTISINGTNHRHSVTTTYLDSARQIIVETDLNAENDKLLKTRTTTDMLGRPILSESTEDGTNYTISVRNAYLNMGQVTLTSSPMRSTAAPTDSWTRVTNDNGGRVTEIATFGGATQPAWTGTAEVFTGAVTSAYNANFTTVTDQAGKVRRSMVDALGRLLRVDEPDAAGNLGSTSSPVQKTEYVYDVLGNLKKVIQGSLQRTFTYDSLSRLRTAINPESGTVTYKYDDNGNLIVKKDARAVSTHYEYDSLNRVTRRWYNGSDSTSDATHNLPALPSGVGATDEARFYYDSQLLPGGAPTYTRGSAIGRLVAQTYGSGTNGDYYAYDVLGRQNLKIQQTGAINYQMSAGYTLSGALSSLTYPSGHTISNSFDQAGRLTSFSGNLGDGSTRTYSTGAVYSSLGSLLKEQFGTNTAVYHKLHYNARAQLCDVRASNVNDDWGGELGAIGNYYSTPWTQCGNGSDNNGNLLMSQTIVNSNVYFEDRYTYDSLNRLTAVNEYQNGTSLSGKQEYDYDRWGNRTLKPASTLGTYKEFTVNPANNRLGVPAGQPATMGYDDAGNLTNDSYTGSGNRTYDAENRITSAWGGNNQAQLYSYDATGQRIKRTVYGVETWQVYGFGGELLAEYPANGPASSPQKEYGYRNGQLLVTAEAAATANVALASNGATVTGSSTLPPYVAGNVIDGSRRAINGTVWLDNSFNSFPDWVEISFNGSKTISEIDVITQQDDPQNPVEPSLAQTFSLYGITAFDVQYWTGSAWTTVPGGSVTGNNKVWRQFNFSPVTTNKIRVVVNAGADNAFSRLVEVEAWTAPATNYARATNGGSATGSSTLAPYVAANVINGSRRAINGTVWLDNTFNSFPDWVEISFNGSKTINEIDVITQQDDPQNPVEPTLAQTFSLYGITAFDVQYWNGSAWTTVPGGSVTGNNKVWRQFNFSPVTTNKIRVVVNADADNAFSRVVEVEAWGHVSTETSSNIHWLVTDHLGTPRMIIDQTGMAANVKRHDYLPFGEELFAGSRTTSLGYAAGDGVRQQFTAKERDVETGLDYFLARYYSSIQGRFTSPDEFTGGPDELFYFADDASENPTFYADLRKPQSLNKYQYSYNNPLRWVDPDGHDPEEPEPQDPRPVAPLPPIPGMPPLVVPGGSTTTSTSKAPNDATIIEGVKRIWELPDPYLYPISQTIGTAPDPDTAPVPITEVKPVPLPTTPPQTIAQPKAPPPPSQARHRTNRRPSNRPKHEEGDRRRKKDQGGEKADPKRERMPFHRKRPNKWKGPWPPKPSAKNTSSTIVEVMPS
jgi:RHS repeat-associated protein